MVGLASATRSAASPQGPGEADGASVVLGYLYVMRTDHGADGSVVAAGEPILEGGVDVGVEDRRGTRGITKGARRRSGRACGRRTAL